MKRLGTVIVFREDVTEEQARKALESISTLITPEYKEPNGEPSLYDYDDTWGTAPVWYLP